MNSIACKNASCAHNRDGCCGAAIIQVRGGATLSGDHTYCNTYSARRRLGAEFGADMEEALAEKTLVACTAIRCAYNEHYACKADHVVIDPSDEHCYTPTQCQTFRPR